MVDILYMGVELAAEPNQRCLRAVERDIQFIAKAPFDVACCLQGLNETLRDQLLLAFDKSDLLEIHGGIGNVLANTITLGETTVRLPKLVIACNQSSILAQKSIEANPAALWGTAGNGIAIVYKHSEVVVWHELFHLFGAEDCYTTNGADSVLKRRTCENGECIMQYAPTRNIVGDPPSMCQKNIDIIRGGYSTSSEREDDNG